MIPSRIGSALLSVAQMGIDVLGASAQAITVPADTTHLKLKLGERPVTPARGGGKLSRRLRRKAELGRNGAY